MVDSIKIGVELEGGEKLKQDWYNIGVAGRQAMQSIAAAAVTLSGVIAAGIAVSTVILTKKMIDFANAAGETERALTQLQKVSGQSIETLSELATVFAGGGTELKKFAAEFGSLAEKIAGAGQGAAIRNAGKETAEWANDLDNVRRKFDNLSNINISFSSLTTLDTKVKGLLESLSRVPQVDQWSKLADIFRSLSSEMDRAQLGKALGLSPETIATLSQGSAALKQMQAEAQRLGLTLTTSNQQALQGMTAQWNQFTALLSAFFQKIGALAAPAFSQMLGSLKGVMQAIVSDFQNLPIEQAMSNLGSRLAPVLSALGAALAPVITAAGTLLGKAFADSVLASIKSSLTPTTSLWDAILNDFIKFGESLVANAAILGNKIKGALGLGGGGGTPAVGGKGMAGGGWVGGRGTGTSDSNLAWLSRGEYITPAHAVRQPGVLAFLEALRQSGGNLSRVLNGMGRFAMGGMVPRSIPAFAAGGLNGGSHVTIQFPGLPPIAGLRASSDVVEQLHKAAALAQVRSGGRKPSRYS